ncbi:MAG: hypothetical protein LBB53_02955 [Prevotellaceae bacterium]|jgi:hypothetical protein|nr:hypothetical protein [Prevotellaceae bacterium]
MGYTDKNGNRRTKLIALTEEFNRNVHYWGSGVSKASTAKAPDGETPAGSVGKLKDSVKAGYRTKESRYGFSRSVSFIGFRFSVHGIWVHYGAYRGHGGQKGSHWTGADGRERFTNSKSLNRASLYSTEGKYPRKDWFNSTLEEKIPELDNVVTELYDNSVLNATNAYIKDGLRTKHKK